MLRWIFPTPSGFLWTNIIESTCLTFTPTITFQPVVKGAKHLTVALNRPATITPSDFVIAIAISCRYVTHRAMLAIAISDFERAS